MLLPSFYQRYQKSKLKDILEYQLHGAVEAQPVIVECDWLVLRGEEEGTGISLLDVCVDFADCRNSGLWGI